MDKGTVNHILVSEQVAQQLRHLHKEYKFIDIGEHVVKHREKIKVFSFLFQGEGNEVGTRDPINKHDKCCRQLMKKRLAS